MLFTTYSANENETYWRKSSCKFMLGERSTHITTSASSCGYCISCWNRMLGCHSHQSLLHSLFFFCFVFVQQHNDVTIQYNTVLYLRLIVSSGKRVRENGSNNSINRQLAHTNTKTTERKPPFTIMIYFINYAYQLNFALLSSFTQLISFQSGAAAGSTKCW